MDHTISNLLRIKEEINLKDSKNPKIIAVTKTFTEENVLPLVKYGHIDFGENKVQEAETKWSTIKNDYRDLKLHMIGKLQTNKVRSAVKIFDYIHSVDSLKLAEKISQEQKKINKDIKLFIQINIGNEEQKNGIDMNETKNFLKVCKNDLMLNVIGLMCIPPNDKNPDKYFSSMFDLKTKMEVKDLSMGMSNDYLSAAKYGATFIRVGSKIFGQRN
tara:strand:+ start:540 stop:1187 length:648 start_codon:yes stop_codon:yes gene_type:complete